MTAADLGSPTAAELSEAAVAGVLADLGTVAGRAGGEGRGVVVDSPPGAGKSTLVVRAAAELAAAGEPLIVVAQTNNQVDDLVDRLALAAPGLPIGRLCGQSYRPTPQVARHDTVSMAQRVGDLASCPLVVGTAAKWATVGEGQWPWAVIDEAYQMRSDLLLQIAGRFRRALFVGDPGFTSTGVVYGAPELS